MAFAIPFTATLLSVLTALALFRQAQLIRKNGSDRNVSHLWYVLLGLNNLAWTIYGFQMNSLPLVITGAVGLLGVATIGVADWSVAHTSHGRLRRNRFARAISRFRLLLRAHRPKR